MEIQIISIIIGIIIGIIICCIDYYRTVNKVRKIYKSWNVGDHLKQTVKLLFEAPWVEPIITDAIVTKKQDKWIEVKYKDGNTENIDFSIFNIDAIEGWEKVFN